MQPVYRVKSYAHSDYKFVVRAKIDGEWKRRYFRKEEQAQAFADQRNRGEGAEQIAANTDLASTPNGRVPAIPRRRVVVVLGMHRSGTSAVAGVLARLGIGFGDRLMPPAQDNEKGFWEHLEIVRLHNKLLESLGSSWDDERPLPKSWEHRPTTAEFQSSLAAIVERDFGGQPIFGFKDPRISRLLPLWLPIFERLEIAPHFVMMVRHPWEVAQSLRQRNAMSPAKAYLLWLRYTLEGNEATREHPRTVVSFKKLLASPENALSEVLAQLDTSRESGAVEEVLRNFVVPSLQHHSASDADPASAAPRFVSDVYETIVEASGSKLSGALESLDANFSKVAEVFDERLTEKTKESSTHEEQARRNAELAASLDQQRQEVADANSGLQRQNQQQKDDLAKRDREIADLSVQFAALIEQQRKEAAGVISDLQRRSQQQKDELTDRDTEIANLSASLEQRRAGAFRVTSDLQQLNQQQKDDLAKREKEVASLSNQLAAKAVRLSLLRAKNSLQSLELRETRRQADDFADSIAELQRVAEQSRRRNQELSSELATLRKWIARKSQRLALQRRNEEAAREVLTQLERTVDKKSGEIAQLHQQLEQQAEQFGRDSRNFVDASWEVLTLRAELLRRNDGVADVAARLAEMEDRANSAVSERDQLRGMVIALTNDLEQERLNVAAVQHLYELAEERNRDSASSQVAATERKMRDFEQQIYASEDRLRAAEANLRATEGRAAATQDQLQTVQAQWAATQEQLCLTGNELAERRAQLGRVRKQLRHRLILPIGKVQERICELTN